MKNSFNKRYIKNHIITDEKILDYFKFKKKFLNKIRNSNLKVNLNKEFKKSFLKNFDKVLVVTYANNNFVLKKLGIKKLDEFKFELVEKIVIKLPQKFKKKELCSCRWKICVLIPIWELIIIY